MPKPKQLTKWIYARANSQRGLCRYCILQDLDELGTVFIVLERGGPNKWDNVLGTYKTRDAAQVRLRQLIGVPE
jgi:hypothetical protein